MEKKKYFKYFQVIFDSNYEFEYILKYEDELDALPANGGFTEPELDSEGSWTALCLIGLLQFVRYRILFSALAKCSSTEENMKLYEIIDREFPSCEKDPEWMLLEWDAKNFTFIEERTPDPVVRSCSNLDGFVWSDKDGGLHGICSRRKRKECTDKILSCVLKRIFEKAGEDPKKVFSWLAAGYTAPYKESDIKELDEI